MQAMALIFDPTIQQCIVHMFTKFNDFSFNSSWENSDKKIWQRYGVADLQTDPTQYSSTFSKTDI